MAKPCGTRGSEWRDAINEEAETREADRDSLHKRFEELETHAHDTDVSYASNANHIFNPQSNPEMVRKHARAAVDSLRTHYEDIRLKSGPLRGKVAGFGRAVNLFIISYEQLGKEYPECGPGARAQVARQALVNDSLQFVRNLEALAARGDEIRAAISQMLATLDDPSLYYATKLLNRYSNPTDVTIKVTRTRIARVGPVEFGSSVAERVSDVGQKSSATGVASNRQKGSGAAEASNAEAAAGTVINVYTSGATQPNPTSRPETDSPKANHSTEQLVTEQRLRFGGIGRFTIGVGVAWSPLSAPEYGVTTRVVAPRTPAAPGDTLRSVISRTRGASSRVTPLVSLSTLLFRFPGRSSSDGLQLTAGIGLRPDLKELDLEYFLGPGVSLFSHRLMVSGGFYLGDREELAQGYSLGDITPGGSVPATSRLRSDVGFALTYRIR